MDFDLIVIGGGSGGVRGARMAASLGARVVLVESGRLGGTCVNVGCVPKKLLSYGAHFAEDLHDMAAYGWTVGDVSFDWSRLIAAKDREIERLNGVYGRILADAGVEVVRGFGRLLPPPAPGSHVVAVGERVLRAPKVLIAVGGRPWRPGPEELPGAELGWSSDDLFSLPALPRRVLIVGAGYVACEFASILRGLGVEVDLVMRGELPLRGFDDEARAAVCAAMDQRGIRIGRAVAPVGIRRSTGGLETTLSDGRVLETDGVLLATGRVPNVDGLGLADAGVRTADDGAIPVDATFHTSAPGIFAVGDVVSRLELTPVALAEAMVFAHQQFGDAVGRSVRYEDVATAVFTSPQLAAVGLTEAAARAAGFDVDVYASSFRPLKHTLTGSPVKSLVKVVVDAATDRVLGIHLVDDDAAEMMQGFAVAMTCGVTKRQLDATLGIHPTVAEELVTLRTKRPRSA